MKSLSAFERISFDLLVDAAHDELNGEFESMPEDERNAYLLTQAQRCADVLRRAMDGFTTNGLESVADWRRRVSS